LSIARLDFDPGLRIDLDSAPEARN
jgi:hypothetical protein